MRRIAHDEDRHWLTGLRVCDETATDARPPGATEEHRWDVAASSDDPDDPDAVVVATAYGDEGDRNAAALRFESGLHTPGQGVIWIAFLSLISGLVLTFYFPRRRVWARLDGDRLSVALATDRYANAAREFDALLDSLAVRLGQRPQIKPTL